jgi:chloramphenicol 3-O-phosphotransferase
VTSNGVLVLSGPPCSGKSQVAKAIVTDSLVQIEIDAVFNLLFPRSNRNPNDRMLAYKASAFLARMVFDTERTPVIECTYAWRHQRTSLVEAFADARSAPLWIVEVYVSPENALRRFQQSAGHQATDLTESKVRERAETFPYSDNTLFLDSASGAAHDLAQQVQAWLRGDPESVEREQWVGAGRI